MKTNGTVVQCLVRRAALTAILLIGVAPLPAAEEVSVKPGINKEYTNANLDVERWVKNFEGESREIFAHRQQILETDIYNTPVNYEIRCESPVGSKS